MPRHSKEDVMMTGICAFVLAMVFMFPFSATAEVKEPRLITVSGDAEVRVVPDEVVFTIGVETSGADLEAAKRLNDERIRRILAITKDYEIRPKDVQTDYLNIQPHYDKNGKLDLYYVRKSVMIVLKDITRFEAMIEAFLKAGGNYVPGIQFRTSELKKHREIARGLAIRAAREKAVKLAAELGQKIGSPYAIKENPTQWWSSYGGRMRNVSQNIAMAAEADSSESLIAPGSISVTANITVSFELK
jgi:uncharacterized protein